MARRTDSNGLAAEASALVNTLRTRGRSWGSRRSARSSSSVRLTSPARRAESVMASASSKGSRTAQSTSVRSRPVTQPSTTSPGGIARQRTSNDARRAGDTRRPRGTATWGWRGSHLRRQFQCAAALTRIAVPCDARAAARASIGVGSAYRPHATRCTVPRATDRARSPRDTTASSSARPAMPPSSCNADSTLAPSMRTPAVSRVRAVAPSRCPQLEVSRGSSSTTSRRGVSRTPAAARVEEPAVCRRLGRLGPVPQPSR